MNRRDSSALCKNIAALIYMGRGELSCEIGTASRSFDKWIPTPVRSSSMRLLFWRMAREIIPAQHVRPVRYLFKNKCTRHLVTNPIRFNWVRGTINETPNANKPPTTSKKRHIRLLPDLDIGKTCIRALCISLSGLIIQF